MADNKFTPFANGSGANVLSFEDWTQLSTLIANGFQSGIAISDQFYGWLAGFRKMAKIMSPPDVVSDFQQFLADISGRYETE